MTNKIPNAKLDFMNIANNLSVTAFFGIVSLGGLISGNPIGVLAGLAGSMLRNKNSVVLIDDFREVVYGGAVALLCVHALQTTEPNLYLDSIVKTVGTVGVLTAIHGGSKIVRRIYNRMNP